MLTEIIRTVGQLPAPVHPSLNYSRLLIKCHKDALAHHKILDFYTMMTL